MISVDVTAGSKAYFFPIDQNLYRNSHQMVDGSRIEL
jgi:hypothetical protein